MYIWCLAWTGKIVAAVSGSNPTVFPALHKNPIPVLRGWFWLCTFLHTFCTPERLDNGCKRGWRVQRMQRMQNTNLRGNDKSNEFAQFWKLTIVARWFLLISGPRVRVPGGAPHQQNPNFFPIGEGFGFFVFFGKQNESLASIEKRPRPYHKKARQTTVRVP